MHRRGGVLDSKVRAIIVVEFKCMWISCESLALTARCRLPELFQQETKQGGHCLSISQICCDGRPIQDMDEPEDMETLNIIVRVIAYARLH